MNLLYTHSRGGTCDRCGKGIVNVAVFENGTEKMEVGLDCAYKITTDDFPTAKAIKAEIKAARELKAFRRAVEKGHYFVKPITNDNDKVLYWSDARNGHYAGFTNEKLSGIRADYRDLILSYAKGDNNYAL